MIPAAGSPPAPPGLSRHPAAAWWGVAAAIVFIVYETTMPFDFHFTAAQWRAGLARSALDLFGSRGRDLFGLADTVGNLLLFVPLGFFLALAPLAARFRQFRPWLLALLAMALSAAVETSQLFSPRRYTQTSDVLLNTVGAAAGLALARAGGRALFDRAVDRALDRLRHDPRTVLAFGLTAAILAGALLPLDLSISRASLLSHLRAADLSLFAPNEPPGSRLTTGIGLLKMAWIFSFWGAATALWFAGRARRPLVSTLLAGAVLALLAEGLQLFVISRTLDPFDPLAGLAGVFAGAALALGGRAIGLGDRALLGLALAGYGCYLALDMISPLDAPLVSSLLQGELPTAHPFCFDPLPFRDAGVQPRMMVLGDWGARLLRFAPLGAFLRLVPRRAAARWGIAAATVAGALGLELLEGRLGAGRGDMTDVVMAAAGLVVGWSFAARLASRLRDAPATGEEP